MSNGIVYDWGRPELRPLLEQLAHDSLTYWEQPCAESNAGELLANLRSLCRAAKVAPRRAAEQTPRCQGCEDLRRRLVNIYHLTLTHETAEGALQAIRAASGPGAPAPAAESGRDHA